MKHAILSPAAFAAVAHAAPLNPAQIPAETQWQVHADLDALRTSETGKMLLSRLEAIYGIKLTAAKRMFSIDPAADLKGLTLYGNDFGDKTVALIHGKFDRQHLEEIVAAASGYTKSEHGGLTIHSWQKKVTRQQHAAFAADDLIVFSRNREALLHAIQVLQAKAPATNDLSFPGENRQPLLVANARVAGLPLYGDSSRILRLARTLSLAANEHEGRFFLHVGAESPDAPDADRLRRLLDGMIAFLEVGDQKFEGLDFRSSVAVVPDKPGVIASASLPVPEWLSVVEKKIAGMERKSKIREGLRLKKAK